MVGIWLREARQRAGLTIDELAVRIHWSRSTISDWETGKRPVPPEVVLIYSRACEAPELIQRVRAECLLCRREAA